MKLLPHAQRLIAEYARLQVQVDELNGLQSGLIRISMFSSVVTRWLLRSSKNSGAIPPNIGCEPLLSDYYTEIEEWIVRGCVGCGFLALPVKPEPETVFLERNPLMAILPEDHPLQGLEAFPVKALCKEPFLLPEKDSKAEISGIFEHSRLTSHVPITTWGNYAILPMAESGLGVSVLPQLILRRIPYRAAIRPLFFAYRDIVPALRSKKSVPLAVKRFLDDLPFRSPAARLKGKPFISPTRSSFS